MSIKERLLGHFAKGNTLSIRNMYLVQITNPAREVARNFEDIYNIPLERKKIDWKENGSSGYFFEYSLSPENLKKVQKIYRETVKKVCANTLAKNK